MDKIKGAFWSAAFGVGVLAAVNALSVYTGAALGWSAFTVGTAAVLGLPGTVLLLAVKAYIM